MLRSCSEVRKEGLSIIEQPYLSRLRVVKFVFKSEDFSANKESGFDVLPEFSLLPAKDELKGVLRLHMNFRERREDYLPYEVTLVAEAVFIARGMSAEEFSNYCRTQGAARVLPSLRKLVVEFLSKVDVS